MNKHEVDEQLIFSWALEHKERVGAYPHANSGPIVTSDGSAAGLSWSHIALTMKNGDGGFPEGLSLRVFLESFHRVWAPLTRQQIHRWVASYRKKHKELPRWDSGSIEAADADGETWANLNSALAFGLRGLECAGSLDQFLHDAEKAKNSLSEELLLSWADEYRDRFGVYPRASAAEPIEGWGGRTWADVDKALKRGTDGLAKRRPSDSLYDFLERHRKAGQLVPAKTMLTIKKIISYAGAHLAAHGALPSASSGKIPETFSETWADIDVALRNCGRGFAGDSSLDEFLVEYSDAVQAFCEQARTNESVPALEVPQPAIRKPKLPNLDLPTILDWLDAFRRANGSYPSALSGKVAGAEGRTWSGINRALQASEVVGTDAKSLARLVRGLRSVSEEAGSGVLAKPAQGAGIALEGANATVIEELEAPFTSEELLAWIDQHKRSEGYFPIPSSDMVDGQRLGWSSIHRALREGKLEGESKTLGAFIKKHRPRSPAPSGVATELVIPSLEKYQSSSDNSTAAGVQICAAKGRVPQVTEDGLLTWIDAFVRKHGSYPKIESGKVEGVSNLTWKLVARQLEAGVPGLERGLTLAKFLYRHYGVVGGKKVRSATPVGAGAAA